MIVEVLVAQVSIESLQKSVLHWLAGSAISYQPANRAIARENEAQL